MKKEKLKLSSLKVKSFVTEIKREKSFTVLGGTGLLDDDDDESFIVRCKGGPRSNKASDF